MRTLKERRHGYGELWGRTRIAWETEMMCLVVTERPHWNFFVTEHEGNEVKWLLLGRVHVGLRKSK